MCSRLAVPKSSYQQFMPRLALGPWPKTVVQDRQYELKCKLITHHLQLFKPLCSCGIHVFLLSKHALCDQRVEEKETVNAAPCRSAVAQTSELLEDRKE